MNSKYLWLPALVLSAGISTQAQTPPTKIGIIQLQQAVVATQDGQKAAKTLEAKFAPKRKDIETKNGEITAMQNQLRASSNTASEEVKNKLMRDIDAKQKSLQRDAEDAQAEFDQEQQRLLNDLGGRLLALIDKYASENNYAMIIDVSAQQSPVIYAASAVDITKEIVALYDKSAVSAPAATPPASKPPAPAAAPAKKIVPPVK